MQATFYFMVTWFCASPLLSFPQKKPATFPFHNISYYGSQQGLNGAEIQGITQDDRGFMWFLTDNGLNRFDGYSFRSFSYDPRDPGSPSVDWFTGLAAGADQVWFSSESSGIYSFDVASETYSNYRYESGKTGSLPEGSALWIAAANEGSIWSAFPNGLNRYNPQTKKFNFFSYTDMGSHVTGTEHIRELLFDRENSTAENNLWIVTNLPSIELFDTRSFKLIKRFPCPFPSKTIKRGFYILGINNKRIWMGSDEEGVYGFDTAMEQFVKVTFDGNHKCKTLGHGLHPAIEDHAGNFWTSNDNNEVVFHNRITNKTHFLKVNKKFTGFRTEWPVFYEDKSHKVWIGTYEGLIAIDNKPRQFFSLRHDENDPTSVSSDHIYSIFRDKGGRMYVAGKTIDMFDRKTNTFIHLKFYEGQQEVKMEPAWSVMEDSKGIIWIPIARDVIGSLDPLTMKSRIHRLYDSSGELKGGFVGIAEAKNGNYWTINWEYKICMYDPGTGMTKIYPIDPGNTNKDGGLTTLFLSSKKILYTTVWQGGMIAFDTEKETYKIYKHDAKDPQSLSQETATPMVETKKGLIWLFTLGGGINVFDPVTEKFRTFTTADGLAHNITSAIVEDKQGNYWVSTRGGLSCFKPPEDPFAANAKIEFHNFDVSDGLPSNVMNMLSAFCDDDGTLFFGTKDAGYFYFHPDSLTRNSYPPPVYITGFSLLNIPQGVRDSNSILQTAIELTREIRLNYRYNTVSFSFAALNYVRPEKNQYRYILEGYEEEWIRTDASKRFANYTNLDPGEYTFKVMASNNDGVWNETPTEIKIIIKPPFWQTTWFGILVALIVIGIVYVFYRYRVRQILLMQKMRNKIAADLHDDIGSTLNSIALYSDLAKKQPAQRDHALEMIGVNSRKIIDSMSDIVWMINPKNDSFDKIIFRMRSLAHDLLKAKKIEYLFKSDETLNELSLPMGIRRNIYLIFKEALNNLLKYSNATRASIKMLHVNENLVLLISDNGVGFDSSVSYNGNGISNMIRRAEEIGGRIKIESANGAGTNIELNVKL